jgi:hypothetical protein
MKKLLLAAILVFMSSLTATATTKAMAVSMGAQDGSTTCTQACTSLTVNWGAPVNAGVLNCTTQLTTDCFLGFQMVFTPPPATGGTPTTIPACGPGIASSSAAPCLGPTALSETWIPGGALIYGNWGVSIISVTAGPTAGSTVLSVPVTTTIAYNLTTVNPPTGLTATPSSATASLSESK